MTSLLPPHWFWFGLVHELHSARDLIHGFDHGTRVSNGIAIDKPLSERVTRLGDVV